MTTTATLPPVPVRGKYFDDFTIGDVFSTPCRTITSTDIVNFACLTGDFNEVHTNFEYCKKNTASGEPIAHGPLVYALSAGLQYASGVNDGTLLALLQIDGWRMIAPVVHGDTVRMITTILEKKASATKSDRGVVTLKRTIVNQREETVQEMQAKLLYRRRPQ